MSSRCLKIFGLFFLVEIVANLSEIRTFFIQTHHVIKKKPIFSTNVLPSRHTLTPSKPSHPAVSHALHH